MAFDNLPPQDPFQTPEATTYAAKILVLSKSVTEKRRCVLDVAYGKDYWQKIDIYLPEDYSIKDLPVLMFAHGGGWTHGYKEWMGFMAPSIVSLPAIFVSISYRLAPDSRYPDPLDDCFSALKWVYDNIERYGGNPQRLFIGGHSAGGHLSTLVALRRDMAESRGLPRDVIKGCLPVSTPFDLRVEKPEPGSSEERVYQLFLRRPEDAAEASPIVHAKGNETPFFITHGSRDLEWVLRTGPPMISALQKQPGRVEYHVFEGSDHFQINLDQGNENNLWVKKVRSWMTEY